MQHEAKLPCTMPSVKEIRPLDIDSPVQPGAFPTTRWTLIVAAAHGAASEMKHGLAALCEAYWYPIYVFLRRKGYTSHEAEDLTRENVEAHAVNGLRRSRFGSKVSFQIADL